MPRRQKAHLAALAKTPPWNPACRDTMKGTKETKRNATPETNGSIRKKIGKGNLSPGNRETYLDGLKHARNIDGHESNDGRNRYGRQEGNNPFRFRLRPSLDRPDTPLAKLIIILLRHMNHASSIQTQRIKTLKNQSATMHAETDSRYKPANRRGQRKHANQPKLPYRTFCSTRYLFIAPVRPSASNMSTKRARDETASTKRPTSSSEKWWQ